MWLFHLGGWREKQGDAEGPQWSLIFFGVVLCMATASLVYIGSVAIRAWQRSNQALVERSTSETLGLLTAALQSDMRGAAKYLIVTPDYVTARADPSYGLLHRASGIFSRFPYAESLIVWKNDATASGATYALHRVDRFPSWDATAPSVWSYPVVRSQDPPQIAQAVAMLRKRSLGRTAFACIETEIAGSPYQIVAYFLFSGTKEPSLVGAVAFTVNLNWVRQAYLAPLLAQVMSFGGERESLSVSVTDEYGEELVQVGKPATSAPTVDQTFQLVFLDNAFLGLSAADFAAREWTLHIRPGQEGVGSVAVGARSLLLLIGLSAFVSVAGLLFIVAAARDRARISSIASELASAVTHELKTPLQLIRLVSDTLMLNRHTSTTEVQEYAQLLSQEAKRLTMSIDNVLAYARSGDPRTRETEYHPGDLGEVITEVIERFNPVLVRKKFQTTVSVPMELPMVVMDRASMILVFDNVVDNAIKYAGDVGVLRVAARVHGDGVRVTVADNGVGIYSSDVRNVFDRFFRGRNASASGSGLGLAIVQRIVKDHGGIVRIRSRRGVGTVVSLWFRALATA